jgi:hypothetical protein
MVFKAWMLTLSDELPPGLKCAGVSKSARDSPRIACDSRATDLAGLGVTPRATSNQTRDMVN